MPCATSCLVPTATTLCSDMAAATTFQAAAATTVNTRGPPLSLPRCLQLRKAPRDNQRPYAVRGRLQGMAAEPDRFPRDPTHLISGLNTQAVAAAGVSVA